MGLREAFQAGAKAIFDAFGNVAVSATYVQTGPISYAITGGTPTPTDTEYAVYVIWDEIRTDQVDNRAVLRNDKIAMIPSSDLSITPSEKDAIVCDGTTWEVVGIQTDPAGALWMLQVRQ